MSSSFPNTRRFMKDLSLLVHIVRPKHNTLDTVRGKATVRPAQGGPKTAFVCATSEIPHPLSLSGKCQRCSGKLKYQAASGHTDFATCYIMSTVSFDCIACDFGTAGCTCNNSSKFKIYNILYIIYNVSYVLYIIFFLYNEVRSIKSIYSTRQTSRSIVI
jgi:hypothetical protein